MPLKRKVLLAMAALVALMAALNYNVLRAVVLPSFGALERDGALADVARADRALTAEADAIARVAADYGTWDGTYAFVAGDNPAYAGEITVDAMRNLGVDVIQIFDRDGRSYWSMAFDWTSGERVSADILGLGTDPALGALLADGPPAAPVSGLLRTPRGPLLLGASRIVDSSGTRPARGTVLFGRLLDAAAADMVRRQVEAELDLVPVAERLPAGLWRIVRQLQAEPGPLFQERERALVTYSLRNGLDGEPALLVRVDHPRDIAALGTRTVRLALLSLVLIGLADMALMWFLLDRLVLRPVTDLKRHVLAVARTGEPEGAVPDRRPDELGVLAREYNRMVARLVALRREVQAQSHRAGMAENAAGTLHNIRNALTPLVGRIDRAIERLERAEPPDLGRALAELRDDAVPAERRARLLDYVEAATRRLADEGRQAAAELEQAQRQIGAVGDILDTQERAASGAVPVEPVRIAGVLDDAADLIRRRFGPAVAVEIDRSLDRAGPVLAQRVGLFQVVHNLLINAAEAIQRTPRGRGRIRVAAAETEEDGRPVMRLEVSDDGAGIEPERLDAIFERGVSSKPPGQGGLGLHWCANAVGAMRGRMRASSGGPGRGATFEVVLPRGAA